MAVFGYFNWHKILPFVSDKLGLQVSSVVNYLGTKAETGVPPEFLDSAYEIDSSQGDKTVRIATSDAPAYKTYDSFIQYYKEQGWRVTKEMEALEAAPEEVESVSKYLTEKLRAAELEKDDGSKMSLAVTIYNEETVGVVWYSQ